MKRKSVIRHWSVLSLAVLLALGTVTLAWPRFKASYRILPVDLAIERYFSDREIPTRRMQTLIGFAGQALQWHDHYRYHDDLSLLYYLRALDPYTPALERRDAYHAAEAEAIEAVKRAPAQPEAWQRIAVVRSVLHDEPERVLEAWRMSVFTGRTHATLLVPRVSLALRYLAWMDAESRSMLRDQLLLAWDMQQRELLRALKSSDPRLDLTRELIGSASPAVLADMEVKLEKVR